MLLQVHLNTMLTEIIAKIPTLKTQKAVRANLRILFLMKPKKKVRDAEGQCPVGADAFGAPRVAQKVKYSAAKICTIVNNGAGSHAPQDSNVAYHIGAQNDDGDPAIVALAASAAGAERKANGLHENDDTLDHLIAMVQSASVVSKDDDE